MRHLLHPCSTWNSGANKIQDQDKTAQKATEEEKRHQLAQITTLLQPIKTLAFGCTWQQHAWALADSEHFSSNWGKPSTCGSWKAFYGCYCKFVVMPVMFWPLFVVMEDFFVPYHYEKKFHKTGIDLKKKVKLLSNEVKNVKLMAVCCFTLLFGCCVLFCCFCFFSLERLYSQWCGVCFSFLNLSFSWYHQKSLHNCFVIWLIFLL